MKLSFIISAIEEFAPLSLQEQWDNSGFQIGLPADADGECHGVMLCLDVTEDIVAEAVEQGCNLILSHHPLIFKGLKRIAGRTPAERTVAAAIRAGVAVYSSHTALDSTRGGISYRMAQMLGFEPQRVLAPAHIDNVRLEVTSPRALATDVRLALLGDLENIDCYDIDEERSMSDPDNIADLIQNTPMCRIEALMPVHTADSLCRRLKAMPVGDVLRISTTPVTDTDDSRGLGVVAISPVVITAEELVERMRKAFGCSAIRASLGYGPHMPVRKIALCGGSGGEFIGAAAASGAQAYISADIRYHDMADAATMPMAIFDVGHFESERCAEDIFFQIIKEKFPELKVCRSAAEQIPVKYL